MFFFQGYSLLLNEIFFALVSIAKNLRNYILFHNDQYTTWKIYFQIIRKLNFQYGTTILKSKFVAKSM